MPRFDLNRRNRCKLFQENFGIRTVDFDCCIDADKMDHDQCPGAVDEGNIGHVDGVFSDCNEHKVFLCGLLTELDRQPYLNTTERRIAGEIVERQFIS